MSLIEQVQLFIERDIRPYILQDGGDIELVSVMDGVVTIKLTGACTTCPFSSYTVLIGVQHRLQDAIPSIKRVVLQQV